MMNVIANRYAEALFQIGEEEKLTDMLYQELSEIVNLIKVNQDLFSILKSPVISKKEKISLIDNIFEDKININIKNRHKAKSLMPDSSSMVRLEGIEPPTYSLGN